MTAKNFNYLISGAFPSIKCETKILSTGEHCPEVGIHKISDLDEYLCEKCFIHWTRHKEFFNRLNNNHGGSRPNSGRPKLGKKKYLITSLPEHIEEIRRYIKELHKPAN